MYHVLVLLYSDFFVYFFLVIYILLFSLFFFFLMIRRPPRSTLFPTRRSSDLMPTGRRRCGTSPRPRMDPFSGEDRKSTRLNSSHSSISYAVFCLKKKKKKTKKT